MDVGIAPAEPGIGATGFAASSNVRFVLRSEAEVETSPVDVGIALAELGMRATESASSNVGFVFPIAVGFTSRAVFIDEENENLDCVVGIEGTTTEGVATAGSSCCHAGSGGLGGRG